MKTGGERREGKKGQEDRKKQRLKAEKQEDKERGREGERKTIH